MTQVGPGVAVPEGDRQKGLPLGVAIAIFLLVVGGVAAAGTVIGYRFFWERNLTPSKQERDQARWEAEVKRSPRNALAWTELGVVFYDKGDMRQAEAHLRKALELEPEANRARYYLGLVLIKQENYDEAERVLREILSRDAGNPLVFSQLATVYAAKKDYKKALEMLDYIIAYIDPYLTDVHYQRGEVLEKMGRKEEAIASYKRAASFDPEFKPAREALKRLGVKPPEVPQDPLANMHQSQ